MEAGKVFGVMQKLSVRFFPDLVESLRKDIPRSLMILGCLQQMDKSPEVTTGDVYVSQWPHPDIVVFENTAYQELLDCNIPPTVVFASCSTEKLKMTLEKSHLKHLFTSSAVRLVGDPRCIVDIANENTKWNGSGLQVTVGAVPYLCALTDVTNLAKHECPPGYYIAPLRLQDAGLVDGMWKFGGRPGTLERFKKHITHSLTAGVYCQHTDHLVSWGLISEYGGISMLYTLECHRRRGLAKAVIYHLAKRLLEQGKTTFNLIEEENENSRQLFCKMGFKIFPDDLVAFLYITYK